MAKPRKGVKLKVPIGYRLSTMSDYHDKKIVLGTLYWIQSYKNPDKIRGKLNNETDKEYNDNYRMVILRYVKKEDYI